MANLNGPLDEQPSPSTEGILPVHQQQQPGPIDMDTTVHQPQEREPQQIVKSIGELAALSAAIGAFKRQYDDLQRHIEFIENSIDSKLNGIDAGKRIDASSSISAALPPPRIDAAENEPVAQLTEEKPDLRRLCVTMCSKGLRKYILAKLANATKLTEEIPEALKMAKDPAKLVFECIGRFYLQGRKAYSKGSPMIPSRKVSLLVLECFLLMADENPVIGTSTKEEAEKAAVVWRKRLMSEGGLSAAETNDARGLLLLIACFGVPPSFSNMDLSDLVRRSNAAEISGALRRSAFLVPIIPGIIDENIKRGLHLDAAELIYTFGLENEVSPSLLLKAFLRTNEEAFEKAKQKALSPTALKEAIKKQLATLHSVVLCLETRYLDPEKVLGGFKIKDQMAKLENDILDLKNEIKEKARSMRVAEEASHANRLYNQEGKRPRLSGMEMPPPVTSYSPVYHAPRDDISALVNSYLGPPSSFPHRSSLGSSSHETAAAHGLVRGVATYESHAANFPSDPYSPSPVPGQSLPWQHPSIHGHSLSGLQRVVGYSPSLEGYPDLLTRASPRHAPSS